MSSHYVSLPRGVEGTRYSDFTVGTSSTAGNLFEFRVLDGVTPQKVEVLKALKAFERFFENAQELVSTGFDVAG